MTTPLSSSAPHAPTPLTAWLRTVLLGALLVPLAVFIGVAWWGLETARTDAEATAVRATTLAAEQAKRTFDIAAEVARKTGSLTAGPDSELAAHELDIRQRLADIATGLPFIINLNAWDAEGRPLVRSDRAPDPSAVVFNRPYFQEQKKGGMPGFGVSDVIRGRQTGVELVNLVLRRPSVDGSFRGVVAVSIAPEFFRDYYRSLTTDNGRLASFALVRADGEILARWPPTTDGRKRMLPENKLMQRIRDGEVSGVQLRPAEPNRESRIASFRRVEGYPLYVVAGFSRNAMFRDWLRFLAVLAGVLVPVTAVLVYVSWVALKKTRQETAMATELREEIRRRSAAERSMLETQKLETLAVLTGGVAHDFNNLLAIVNTSLHLHTRKHPAEAEEPQLKAMARAIQSGVRLTRQLLSFTRKQALHPETIELQSWLPATAELLRTTLGGTIRLRHDVAPGTRPLVADAAELELALINLAVNARHALPDGGNFVVAASNAAHPQDAGRPMVRIRVQDDGVGIPPEVLPRVTEPFFTTRERGAGSGLGLSQVHGLVQQAGGVLRIESPPGAGTTVYLFFPPAPVEAAEAEAAAAAAIAVARETAASVGKLAGSLLLVEDNDEVAQSTADMLVASGLQVTRMASAREALDHLAAAAPLLPDVVLSDIAMPGGMDGIQLAFALRERHPGLPVLLATGYADQLDVATSGGLEVLPKPLAPDNLLRRLRELLA
ncbi:MAG: ATP-binding protein [Pseudomonadota bacterium]